MSNNQSQYFPCFQLLKGAIVDKDMPVGGRIFIGFLGAVGTIVYDPVDAIFNLLDLDKGEPVDPSDMNYQNKKSAKPYEFMHSFFL